MQYLMFRGALYHRGAPLRLVETTRAPNESGQAHEIEVNARKALNEALAEQEQLRQKWHEGLARIQQLAAEQSRLEEDVRIARQDYQAGKEDVQYYQEVLVQLDRQNWDWLREHSWLR